MIEGRCPKCHSLIYGWALAFPRNQVCSKCGAALEIFQDGKLISVGYSPFTAEKYVIKQPTQAELSQHERKNASTKDKQKSS